MEMWLLTKWLYGIDICDGIKLTMKLQSKIILISFAIAIIAALLFSWFDRSHKATSDYLLSFGITGFFCGLLPVVVGLFLLLKTDKRYAQGF